MLPNNPKSKKDLTALVVDKNQGQIPKNRNHIGIWGGNPRQFFGQNHKSRKSRYGKSW